ncbi:2-isopropylmalate synthase [Gammaproteobacteria bacterium]|nr:2-isopropylmalate synthase [Gammaproteobacteria bacterium]MDB9896269.1 2-isopropylmalate synthase [Gammaproteobacteria bacterium]MDC0091799.1 2-isopropylmalate synthase [Gammaproteobacteria bacterium]MDC1474841.1 2-isopropylmalate synthase [Gammaproteobacteria bacterium]MDC1526122.1 2-isopropylmalate synthase [Gammaproteobacteria bacterium]|tara:strand:+ start:1900 stop:3570 length:1671 start_codon:yes stop_codon:yes gene_type:complete
MKDLIKKYKPFQPIPLQNRQWPNQVIQTAPTWCSVDLRDGNQALIEPMGHERKKRMFKLLCDLGFKQIEVGFPAASQTDFDFVRWLIEEKKIPSDVTIQVLTQARDHIIERTFESLDGIPQAIVHFYNSTSTLQRKVVFNQDKEGVKKIAIDGASLVKKLATQKSQTKWMFEYSPESFTGTELEFAADVCDSVVQILKDASEEKIIINLPATVEMATANIYGDQIEWMNDNLKERENISLSLHPHNDRGTAVAASEFGLMAGADRVEGTLFGNGERTGNVDVVTLALNLLTQGVDPELDFSDINSVIREVEYCNQLPVHPRHPYAGDLVFTAFSGSHQDAIKKGLHALSQSNSPEWAVPYLPIDPSDLGRSYEAVVRINSQSGKGGIAFILEKDHGLSLPRRLQINLSEKVQAVADQTGKEVISSEIWHVFEEQYLQVSGKFKLDNYSLSSSEDTAGIASDNIEITLSIEGKPLIIYGTGGGPIEAFVSAINSHINESISVSDYHQHSVTSGSDAKAAAYIELTLRGKNEWGAGMDGNTVKASFQAILAGLNKLVT